MNAKFAILDYNFSFSHISCTYLLQNKHPECSKNRYHNLRSQIQNCRLWPLQKLCRTQRFPLCRHPTPMERTMDVSILQYQYDNCQYKYQPCPSIYHGRTTKRYGTRGMHPTGKRMCRISRNVHVCFLACSSGEGSLSPG